MEKDKKQHVITIEDRNKFSATGIEKVLSSSPTLICVVSSCGSLYINGNDLKITDFSVSLGNFSFTGCVNSIKYTQAKTPIVKKLFK